jgi:hypothetical protein
MRSTLTIQFAVLVPLLGAAACSSSCTLSSSTGDNDAGMPDAASSVDGGSEAGVPDANGPETGSEAAPQDTGGDDGGGSDGSDAGNPEGGSDAGSCVVGGPNIGSITWTCNGYCTGSGSFTFNEPGAKSTCAYYVSGSSGSPNVTGASSVDGNDTWAWGFGGGNTAVPYSGVGTYTLQSADPNSAGHFSNFAVPLACPGGTSSSTVLDIGNTTIHPGSSCQVTIDEDCSGPPTFNPEVTHHVRGSISCSLNTINGGTTTSCAVTATFDYQTCE